MQIYENKLLQAFAMAYHNKNHRWQVAKDNISPQLFNTEEFSRIKNELAKHIKEYMPHFSGRIDQGMPVLINGYISPVAVGYTAFYERCLKTAALIGAKQFVTIGSGYDTFGYRQPQWAEKMELFVVDNPFIAADMQSRLTKAGINPPENMHYIYGDVSKPDIWTLLEKGSTFNKNKATFVSLWEQAVSMEKENFKQLVVELFKILPEGSSLSFFYSENGETSYSYAEMEAVMSQCGMLIYEHLSPEEMEPQFFADFNIRNIKCPLKGAKGINYVLAVKKEHHSNILL